MKAQIIAATEYATGQNVIFSNGKIDVSVTKSEDGWWSVYRSDKPLPIYSGYDADEVGIVVAGALRT